MKWLRRNIWRLLIAAAAAVLALGYVPESHPELASILPRLSPILSLFGALATRAWLGWLMLLGIPLLVLAAFKGRESAGEYQADEPAVVARLSSRVSGR